MEGEKSVKITNNRQFECLVQLMEKNVEIAKGFFNFGSSKQDFTKTWSLFAEKLNSLGPPIREGTGWQQIWNDFQGKIKRKMAHNKKELVGTDGGTNKLYTLSPLEESAISLLCYDKIFPESLNRGIGLPSTPSTMLPNHDSNMSADYLMVEYLRDAQVTGSNSPVRVTKTSFRTKNKKNKENEERLKLLKVQTKSVQQTEKYAKESARYTRKIFEVKEKKLDLWRKEQLAKRQYRKDNMELKLRTLKYKEKKLAIKEIQLGLSN